MTDARVKCVRSLRAKLVELETRTRGRSTSFSRSGLAKLLEIDLETEELDRELEHVARLVNERGRAVAKSTLNGLEVTIRTDGDREADVTRVLEAWRDRFSPKSSVDDAKRRARVSARLDSGRTVEELLLVLEGVERSDWHTGRDPRTRGKRYVGIETIFRDDSQIDKFLELSGVAVAPATDEVDDLFAAAIGER